MHALRSGPLVNVILQYDAYDTYMNMNSGLELAIKNHKSSGFGQFTFAIALDQCCLIRVY